MLVDLEGTLVFFIRTKTNAGVPTAPTGSVTFAVYGPAGTSIASGTMTGNIGSVASLYSGSIACTSGASFASSQNYTIVVDYTVSAVALSQEIPFTVT